MTSKDSPSLFERLNAPFPYEEYSVNHDGFVSVSPQATSDRLNEVFGPEGWKLEVAEQIVDMNLFSVSILGKISIRDERAEWIEKAQFGDSTMVIQRSKTEPTAQAILDSKKKALSDAMKKCASLLGVASDVYRGRFTVVRKDTVDYKRLLVEFKLNSNSKQFKEGIVLLPDHYQAYYLEKGWEGLFVSDFHKGNTGGIIGGSGGRNNRQTDLDRHDEAMANLKSKYEAGNGTLNGFEDWLKKMQDKGHTCPQMDYILQDAINKKAEKSTTKHSGATEQRTANSNDSSPKGKTEGNNASSQQPNEDTSLVMEFAELHAEGESDPYYRLTFKHKGIPTEIIACGPLVTQIDNLDLKEGSKCKILTREAKGKNVLRQIKLVS
ncbi:Rad52/22 family double-strand break repair protein [Paenibacillus sp. yr247]|uniref:Rad52/Rad22 family DNA repair protein n=1 Tax=Paenibacillus sp. yr247 TaxID=1761880 RepID=UPI00088D74AD|nr:Rad52/Rad22 family DNA repair protein [Paenibacillus sp. yr247]SDP01762.1 Rad52/22 family double-strand break repair protein [Paenibacillus sp. yr247]